MKKVIRLTESDLHRIVKESVKRVINEAQYGLDGNRRGDWLKLMKMRAKELNPLYDTAEFEFSYPDYSFLNKSDIERMDKLEKAGVRDQYYANGGKSFTFKKNKPVTFGYDRNDEKFFSLTKKDLDKIYGRNHE